jgi:hypothetical protein
MPQDDPDYLSKINKQMDLIKPLNRFFHKIFFIEKSNRDLDNLNNISFNKNEKIEEVAKTLSLLLKRDELPKLFLNNKELLFESTIKSNGIKNFSNIKYQY